MSGLSALALAAGVLGGLMALWVDQAVTRRQSDTFNSVSLAVCAGFGLAVGLLSHLTLQTPLLTGAALAASTALAVAVSTDLRFGQLSDLTSLIIAVAAMFAAPILTPGLTRLDMVIAAALAAGILLLAGLYGRLRRGEMGLGSGDILLAGALGLWCPPQLAALSVALGAGFTLAAGVVMGARNQTRLPFGPGLAAGFALGIILDRVL
ncbi:prepilin peptidase [Oceanicaulis sp. MMSF_3324]|uniref:prepilin peptidase n=1 Tax=Oceanicaulis sp. MMSF_3324 TaxID=3046702 RepID=UPI00273F554D|nr:prepilin peptidase [Oceanicaulis sp. MMSF_3324]